jgi:hypothetical protein
MVILSDVLSTQLLVEQGVGTHLIPILSTGGYGYQYRQEESHAKAVHTMETHN